MRAALEKVEAKYQAIVKNDRALRSSTSFHGFVAAALLCSA